MCMQPGDLKITMGTGTFLNVNTGDIPHASVAGNFFFNTRIIDPVKMIDFIVLLEIFFF